MEPSAIVKRFNIIEHSGAGLQPCGKLAVVDQLVFEAAPERLDIGVVVRIALGDIEATH